MARLKVHSIRCRCTFDVDIIEEAEAYKAFTQVYDSLIDSIGNTYYN